MTKEMPYNSESQRLQDCLDNFQRDDNNNIAEMRTVEHNQTNNNNNTSNNNINNHASNNNNISAGYDIRSEIIDHHDTIGMQNNIEPNMKMLWPPQSQNQNQNYPSLGESQPSTVVGVGGTITTVTSSNRKTAPLPRLVAKNGTVNLFMDNVDRSQYVRDLFTTMIDIKWRYNLLAAAFGFVFSWLFFACIWYVVLYVHDDLSHQNDATWSPCIVNVNSFSAALLFSIETQSTLGFGSRIISVECPGAIVIFCIQLIFGVVVECLIVGMVFAKLSRPAKRSQTIMYSKYATICLREGQMCLIFRVGDVRSKSHIIGATIRASLVSQKITEEGETIPFYHHQLDFKIDDSQNSLLIIWPVTVVHLIDSKSPFYRLDADQLASFKFEIITILEGTVESTGQSIQVRSSYLPSEVKWGYRFEPIVSTHGYGRYAQTIIDYNKFNHIVEVKTPRCSPMEYYTQLASDQQLHLRQSLQAYCDTNI